MKKILLALSLLFINYTAFADSPLTSTNFYTVYEEYDIVQEALDAHGKINNDLMLYLSNKAYPIDVKVAVINALGWNIDGQGNYNRYLNFIEMRTGLERNQDAFYTRLDADELLCLAYLKAMDNYFDVADAKIMAEFAVKKTWRSQRSYTFNLINALIGAQMQLRGDWCKLYQTTQSVKENQKLKNDFPAEAKEIIFDYMNLYKGDCKD